MLACFSRVDRSRIFYGPSVILDIGFKKASVGEVVLARVGNRINEQPLETSREVCEIRKEDQDQFSQLILKPFRSHVRYRFDHHASLDRNETFSCVRDIFSGESSFLEKGCELARRLYAKTDRPNIKAGDLCIARISNAMVSKEPVEALCILKSETVEPFLSISSDQGDLRITTEHGINPDKIDKGCLILNVDEPNGYHVLTFDRAGAQSRFWLQEFLGVRLFTDDSMLTTQVADLAVSFLQGEKSPVTGEGDGVTEKTVAANRAIEFFENRDHFSMQEFEEEVLRKDPAMVSQFKEYKASYEKDHQPLSEDFGISPGELTKVRKKVGGVMKFDTGVEVRLLPDFQDGTIERGFDEARAMGFLKVYFNSKES
ncbi:MAG TPA: hypothetical protein DIV39_04985 [Verrucomicrobiales bacterium]|nr:hypothetical protein [Verrucomicrobiales bacterium]